MFEFFYNVLLGLYLFLFLPVLLINFKKYRSTIVGRFFFRKKNISVPFDKKVVWVHAVSLGETKVAALLIKKINEENKDLFFIVSNTTKTGFAEAEKNIPFADYHLYLPVDFSWIMKKMMVFFKPHMVILIETDFWYNFIKYAKLNGATVALVNGKLSDMSFKRFKALSFFSKRLFSFVDLFLVQDNQYLNRFLELNTPKDKIHVTGNLKFDFKNKMLSKLELDNWRRIFKLKEDEKIVTIASTHSSEEDLILRKIDYSYKYFLAPRHPERFAEVKDILKKRNIPFGAYSTLSKLDGSQRVILIDAMGILNVCYALSSLAIVGGSFVENVGGHNILEPVFVGTPVFFGPYMYSQEEMRNIVLKANCGAEISLENIEENISQFFTKQSELQRENCIALQESLSGNIDKTTDILKKFY